MVRGIICLGLALAATSALSLIGCGAPDLPYPAGSGDGGVDGDATVQKGRDGGHTTPRDGAGRDGDHCGSGEIECSGTCVSSSSTKSCGRCGNVCTDSADGGVPACAANDAGAFACTTRCTTPAVFCGHACVTDTATNPDHCGEACATCSPGAVCSAGACYSALTDATKWSAYDLSILNLGAVGYSGGTFDGRYVYLAPGQNSLGRSGVVARFDTHDPTNFNGGSAASAWSTFNLAKSVDAGATSALGGFAGAAFDGRHVYLVPSSGNGGVARFDTQGSGFTSAAAWSALDLSVVSPQAVGFVGATFDGTTLFLAPYDYNLLAKYDVTLPFTAPDWSTVPLPGSTYQGAVYDGTYVYFIPYSSTQGVTLYDPATGATATYNPAVACGSTDITSCYFFGGAFDGRYLYLAPTNDTAAIRFDTTKGLSGFTLASSWSGFQTNTAVFAGAAFDGRYVYFIPAAYSSIVRFDTEDTGGFGSASAWTAYDLSAVENAASGSTQAITFRGAVFDGRFLYLVPYAGGGGGGHNGNNSGIVVRFDAKSPSAMPKLPAFHGSFY